MNKIQILFYKLKIKKYRNIHTKCNYSFLTRQMWTILHRRVFPFCNQAIVRKFVMKTKIRSTIPHSKTNVDVD